MSDQEVAALLAAAGGSDGAAAQQGSFFGLACTVRGDAPATWVRIVLEDWPDAPRSDDCADVLSNAARGWLGALRDGQLDYALLLPDDDAPLALRTDALGQWCQGFLFGLAQGGVKDHASLPGDVPEYVRDILAISHAVAEGEANDDERAFAEVCEYVRVGAQLVFDELRGKAADGARQVH